MAVLPWRYLLQSVVDCIRRAYGQLHARAASPLGGGSRCRRSGQARDRRPRRACRGLAAERSRDLPAPLPGVRRDARRLRGLAASRCAPTRRRRSRRGPRRRRRPLGRGAAGGALARARRKYYTASLVTRRASRVYGLAVAIAALGALATAAAVLDLLRGIDVQSAHAAHLRFLGERLTAPAINVAAAVMLPLAAIGLVSVFQGMRSCVRQLAAQRRFLDSIAVTGRLPSHPQVWLVDDDRPQAFCAGHSHPRVFVSTGAVRLLEAVELDAVLAHEAHHRLRRDPLRIAAARGLCDALFFLPVLRRLTERYCALAELGADEAAVRRAGGDAAPLASALLAFDEAADPAVVGIAPERVDHLLGAPPGGALPGALLALAAVPTAAVGALAWQVGRGALVTTSLSLPVLSRQPCIVVLAAMPLALAAGAAWLARRRA